MISTLVEAAALRRVGLSSLMLSPPRKVKNITLCGAFARQSQRVYCFYMRSNRLARRSAEDARDFVRHGNNADGRTPPDDARGSGPALPTAKG